MHSAIRFLLVLVGFCALGLALAFYFRWSWVQDFWPWTDSTSTADGSTTSSGYYGYYSGNSASSSTGESDNLSRLSYYFLSSIFAAFALPVIWIGLTGELAAIIGGAVNLTITNAGLAVYILQSYDDQRTDRLLVAGLLCGVGVVVSAVLLFWARRFSFRDRRPTPVPVRIAFAIFTIGLIIVSVGLITKQPHIFPWPLPDEVSVVYGWIFLGASAYFAYGLLRPRWNNACGQLLGFLAYDVVLMVPFLNHFGAVADAHRASLIVYTAVVSISGLLAIYYVFLNPATRIWRVRKAIAWGTA